MRFLLFMLPREEKLALKTLLSPVCRGRGLRSSIRRARLSAALIDLLAWFRFPPLCISVAAGADNGCSFQRPRGVRPQPQAAREGHKTSVPQDD